MTTTLMTSGIKPLATMIPRSAVAPRTLVPRLGAATSLRNMFVCFTAEMSIDSTLVLTAYSARREHEPVRFIRKRAVWLQECAAFRRRRGRGRQACQRAQPTTCFGESREEHRTPCFWRRSWTVRRRERPHSGLPSAGSSTGCDWYGNSQLSRERQCVEKQVSGVSECWLTLRLVSTLRPNTSEGVCGRSRSRRC